MATAMIGRRAAVLPGATVLLMLSMLSTGAAGLVTEYLLATVSTYVLGNSIEQFSVVIAVMFFTMGAASFMQKFVGDDYLIEKFVLIEITLTLLGAFAPLAIYGAFAILNTFFPVALIATVALIGFLIGFEIPLIIRINSRYVGELKANLGWILSMDYLGGFIGAIIWVMYLLPGYPLTEISFIVSGFNFIVAVATIVYFMHTKAMYYPRLAALLIAATATALVVGYMNNRDWSMSIEQGLYRSPIVHAETSKYQRIVLTHDASSDDWRLFLNGGLQFSSLDEAVYHEHLVHPAMALAPRRNRVLILGGGDGLALREVLKYRDVREVLLVDIDPAIIRLASTHKALRALNEDAFADARVTAMTSRAVNGEGFRRIHMETGNTDRFGKPEKARIASVNVMTVDAFKYVAEAGSGPWDVVIIDFPDPDQVEIAKLYSREFYRALGAIIARDGYVALQATSPHHAREVFLCIGRTMAAAGWNAIPYHANVPSFGDWGWYLASPTIDSRTLREKMSTLPAIPETKHLTQETARAALAFGKNALAARFDHVSSVMEPHVHHLYVRHAWQVE